MIYYFWFNQWFIGGQYSGYSVSHISNGRHIMSHCGYARSAFKLGLF
jgi:hypothetical protein